MHLFGVLFAVVVLIGTGLPQAAAATEELSPILLQNINTKTGDARDRLNPATT
jgi:hypothetical protein